MNEKVSVEPQFQDRSLLAADRDTAETRRIETDADGNLFVNIAEGEITVIPSGTQDVNIVSSIELDVEVQNFPAVQTVDGTVSVGNFPAVQDVEIVATIPLPVIGPLTDDELRATPVDVLVTNFPAVQPVSDNGGSLTVDAVSWPLPTGAATEAKQTQPGVDIGDVTVNNAAGASAVNIQDGGNIITVDSTDLDIRDLLHTQDSIKIGDGTDFLEIYPDGSIVGNVVDQRLGLQDKLFGINVEVNAATATEVDLFLLTNPSLSGKNLLVRYFTVVPMDTVTRHLVRVYVGPTITNNGTTATPHAKLRTSSPTASAMNAFTLPTISARGTRIRSYASYEQQPVSEDFRFATILQPGQSLLVTGVPNSSNKLFGINIDWAEIA